MINNDMYKDWFVENYDRIVGESGTQGSTAGPTREGVSQAYKTAVESKALPRWESHLLAEGRDLFDKYVMNGERASRARSLKNAGEYILDAVTQATLLKQDDPYLSFAFPLGTVDGLDKLLKHWNRDDWQTATTGRYRKAAESTAAAAGFDAMAEQIVKLMVERDADTVGDLFNGAADEGHEAA